MGSWFSIKKAKLILIVEDEEPIATVLAKYLELQGFKTAWARDGVQGVELAEKLIPDLILLDIIMPKMDGFTALQMIKSKPKTQDIPILACTSLNMIEDVERFCKNGAAGYITKPFDLKRVLEKINATLELPHKES